VFLLINHAFRSWRGASAPRSRAGALGGWALTFVAVVVAFVFFRATSLEHALRILSGMAGLNGFVMENNAPAIGSADWFLANGLMVMGAIPNFLIRPALVLVAIGMVIALLLPNTQQIFRLPFEPPAAAAPAPRPARMDFSLLLHRLRWRPTFAWAAACGMLLAASLIWMQGTTRFLYFQF
jgi:hypothetical protein